ncbi:MAG: kinase [Candidatus Sericytochromatia bacterium]|nr:kinase [Candidatus Sericytochromatia bacterium]
MKSVKLNALDGTPIEFINQVVGQGSLKDCYFSPDPSYVVLFYREKQDHDTFERLKKITGTYRQGIFTQAGGDYWQDKFCWPSHVLQHEGRLGLVCPSYDPRYLFTWGSVNQDMFKLKGREKEGKWFASARHRARLLDPREKGDWLKYFRICILLSRSVRRMHAIGLAHSDLSYKNVLIDPVTGSAVIVDVDGLVVPNLYPPQVLGTPDFIAPEVMASNHLAFHDPTRKLPSRQSDQHALAVLIYMYLLYRHPLRGRKVHDPDNPELDEKLAMGDKALFIEHNSDLSNRPNLNDVHPAELPWIDVSRLPAAKLLGPYLYPLVERAFVVGLHQPELRPSADEWEHALVKTVDLLQPCPNPDCEQKWFVFDNTLKPVCPFCQNPFKGLLPVLNFYYARKPGIYSQENYRLMVYHNQYLYPWHVNRQIFANEKLSPDQIKPVGYFVWHQGAWWLVNQTLPDLWDKESDCAIPPGQRVMLKEGGKLLLSREEGGRLAMVQLVQGN